MHDKVKWEKATPKRLDVHSGALADSSNRKREEFFAGPHRLSAMIFQICGILSKSTKKGVAACSIFQFLWNLMSFSALIGTKGSMIFYSYTKSMDSL